MKSYEAIKCYPVLNKRKRLTN